ncbi:protein phosphatase 1 regulatory subunit 36-like isoform X2 [Belonocnema kinseyi]|uniref:protein phosphatase 1 regulatory subunit 36-like isoform X2 n=1 Tax=Belonocnema kinseyi TaxID=2817044 RepID=UPI00143D30DA|nr:protein phosphatase 1 regulatory subunit 36-like isoform X2 [Belonocnema kinseyi]
MGERKFVWDEFHEGITLFGITKQEDEQKNIKGRPSYIKNEARIFCPHSYLVLNFQESLNPTEEMKFKRHFMRKITPMEPDIIILQDIKNLVLYLITRQLSVEFIQFFHRPIVDRFLRALIIYFQFFTETWEELMETRNATEKKAENPLTRGSALKRADDLNCLRCILGKEYSNIITGGENGARYHHMMAGEKSLIQSQNEKDLRIFETLIGVSHRVVWIALKRQYFHLIEIELQRLFRTDAYNTAGRKNPGFYKNIQENEILELHGPKMLPRRKLLRNSPLPYQVVYTECDFRLLALDVLNSKDPRINYLQNALLLHEEKLTEFGIEVGILGMPRSNFDIFLLPLKEGESERQNNQKFEEYSPLGKKQKQERKIPPFGSDFELDFQFLPEPIITSKMKRSRMEEKKKWIERVLSYRLNKKLDTPSATVTWE